MDEPWKSETDCPDWNYLTGKEAWPSLYHMANGGESKREIRPLTGVRGFAASLVLLIHFGPMWILLFPPLHFLRFLSLRGLLGVDLFFILSGFILCYVYFDPSKSKMDVRGYRSFIWHRIVRIWPVHVATIGILIFLVLGAHLASVTLSGRYPFSVLPFQLTMTHAWLDTLTGKWTWNYPAWSISAEWFAYLLIFPSLWPVLKRLGLRPGFAFLLSYLSVGLWAWVFLPLQIHWLYDILMVTFEFVSGALLYVVFQSPGSITRICQRLATLVFVLIVAVFLVSPVVTIFSSCLITLFPALVLGLTSETAMIARLFATAPALWLGRVSFSLYMTQAITQKVLKVVFYPERYEHSPLLLRLALIAGTLVAIFAFASLCYYLVENPARNYLRGVAERRNRRGHQFESLRAVPLPITEQS